MCSPSTAVLEFNGKSVISKLNANLLTSGSLENGNCFFDTNDNENCHCNDECVRVVSLLVYVGWVELLV